MKNIKKILSLLLCLIVTVCMIEGGAINSYATSKADIERLKEKQASDEEILNAITARVNELSAKIETYNNKIYSINATISANNAEIEENRAEIEEDKFEFQKRIRSIGMTNSDSPIKILLGAKNFSQFLQLSQLTSSISSHDKKLMDDLAAKIQALNEKNEENQRLLDEQRAIKAELDKDYAELSGQQAEAQSIYNKTTSDLDAAQAAYDAEQAEIARRAAQSSWSGGSVDPSPLAGTGTFIWPSDYYYISAGFQSNDSVHNGVHNGIDIAGSGIHGAPIYAAASGTVTYVANSCPHDFGKSYGCGCGGNYGRYCQISHDGDAAGFSTIYAHACNIIVSTGQYVQQGQVVGYVGSTGWSTGNHLHFGVYSGGYPVNPLNYVG